MASLALLLAYLLVAEFVHRENVSYRLRMTFLWVLVLLAVLAPASKMILLRQQSGPASYSHDGGVIQTEAAIDFFMQGKNPYVEDYTQTPMAEWGIDEFRTALYHYPYLPWTFLFSAPFQWLSRLTIGWYDQRLVYSLSLRPDARARRLHSPGRAGACPLLAAGFQPDHGIELIYGQNDSFVLAWLVLSFWLYARGQHSPGNSRWTWGAAAAFGLACARKPDRLVPGAFLPLPVSRRTAAASTELAAMVKRRLAPMLAGGGCVRTHRDSVFGHERGCAL